MPASDSSSSAAWSDTEDDDKRGETVESLPSQSPAKKLDEGVAPTRSRHGEKLPFQAPQEYLPSFFSNSLMTQFGYEAVKASREKQLWIIKIPEGLSPSALDGTVVKVPKSSSTSQSVLAEIELDGDKRAGARPRKYYLKRQRQAHSREGDVADTQLIAMAGGNSTNVTAHEQVANVDFRSLRVLLPHSGTQAGCYVSTSRPIQEHLHMVLMDESSKDSHSKQTIVDGGDENIDMNKQKRMRVQPMGKLNGRFIPAGARSIADMKADFHPAHRPDSPVEKSGKLKTLSPRKEKKSSKCSTKVKASPSSR